jgi:preprotein translocase subunit Sss1
VTFAVLYALGLIALGCLGYALGVLHARLER